MAKRRAEATADRAPVAEHVLPARVSVQSMALTVLATLALIVLLRYAADFFVPLVLGVFVSYALEPVVGRLVAWRIRRPIAAALVLLALVGSFGWATYALSDDALDIVRRAPEAGEKLRDAVGRISRRSGAGPVADVARFANEVEKSAEAAAPASPPPPGVTRVQVEQKPIDVRSVLWSGSMNVAGLVSQALLLVFLVYFLLASGDLYKRKLVRLAGEPLSRKRVTLEVLDEINTQIRRFLFVQVVTSTVVAVASWAAFRWMGLGQAAVWGILAGLFNSIPYLGPLIVMAGVGLVGFLQFGTISQAASVAALSFVITSVEGLLLTPWLIGRTSRMNEVAVFVGLLFWAWVWGIVGMLLAVPMLVIVKAVCDRVDDLKPVGELLGE
jgi:predicted PurR-regulated permease PerM